MTLLNVKFSNTVALGFSVLRYFILLYFEGKKYRFDIN